MFAPKQKAFCPIWGMERTAEMKRLLKETFVEKSGVLTHHRHEFNCYHIVLAVSKSAMFQQKQQNIVS